MKSKRERNRKNPNQPPPAPKEPALSRILDIPASAFTSMPQMELSGNREAIIEGCQGVLEYDENVVKLAAGKMSVKFTGRNLQIKALTHNSAVVNGIIDCVEFIV